MNPHPTRAPYTCQSEDIGIDCGGLEHPNEKSYGRHGLGDLVIEVPVWVCESR
jgi:hypothetical protein